MNLTRWKTQLQKGATEMAVLSVLARGRSYGREIAASIQEGATGLRIPEGTIYPLLNRLEREGKVQAAWVDVEDSRHPRKYYQLTAEGAEVLDAMKAAWQSFRDDITRLIG